MASPPSRWWRRLRRTAVALALVVAALLLLRLALFRGPVLPPEPLPPGPFLDLHCHVAGIGAGDSGCFVSRTLQDSRKFGIYLGSFSVSAEELEEHGDALVVERLAEQVRDSRRVGGAVVLALDGVIAADGTLDRERTEVYVPNEFVAAQTARHPELFFGASINPYRPDAIERLDRAVADGAVLLKWLPSIMFVDPADEALTPFYRRLVHHGLPLLTHAGQERSFTHARDELADPVRLRLPLRLGVKVIAAHAATTGENEGQDNLRRLIGMLDEFPNLYADVSSLTQLNKLGLLREVLAEPRFEGRLLYGSDYPLIATLLVSPWYFPLDLEVAAMRDLAAESNPWDQDVRLKQALGVPAAVFARSAAFLGVELPR